MNAREFYDKVCEMRKWKREFFKFHTHEALNRSKRLEREIDAEINRIEELHNKQINLFNK